jgi:putative DNA primase/helicase
MPMSTSSLLEHALQYASLGWSVLPLHSIENGVCTCGKKRCASPGKHPLVRKWAEGKDVPTTDKAKIREWWDEWPNANIGIATGLSGLFVVDIDPRNGGMETYRNLTQEYGPPASDLIVFTGGGGIHRYFAKPPIPVLRSKEGNGIDLKCDGGYVVAPPSKHVSGKFYEWGADPTKQNLASLPDAWVELVCSSPTTSRKRNSKENIPNAIETCETYETGETGETYEDKEDARKRRTHAPQDQEHGGVTDLPLTDDEQFVRECIEKTVPTESGKRHDGVFRFARMLKGRESIAARPLISLRPYVYQWYETLVKTIGRDSISADADENWFDFSEGWDKVQYAGEFFDLQQVLDQARQEDPPKAASFYKSEEVRLVISLCRQLQRKVGDHPFFLSTSNLACLFNWIIQDREPDCKKAWRIMDGLARDGVLEITERGDAKRRRAHRYRYLGDVFEPAT